MKILAIEIEKPNLSAGDFEPFLEAEAKHVWDLYKSNVIREIYFREDQKSAVLVLEAENKLVAEQILSEFPLVKNGLITFDIIPLTAYPGFERLFKS